MSTWLVSLVRALVVVGSLGGALAQAADPQSFTIAVLPDTQNYLDYTHQKAENFPFDASELFLGQMKFVAGNLQSQGGDIAFVTSLGDVWQHQTLKMDPEHEARGFKAVPNAILDPHTAPTSKARSVEMPMARRGFEMIAGKVPFSVVPGNHDYDAMWTHSVPEGGPSYDPKDVTKLGMLHLGGLNNFRSVFGADTAFFKGQPWYVASHDGGADSAQIFTAGGYRFLHIGLQFDPPNASLEWAASVLERYPGLPTIISTHDYMNNAGQRLPNPIIDASAADPQDNSPQMVWDKLISQHDQIFLVLCGHEYGQALRTDDNKFGHDVYQVLADYQNRGQTATDAGVKTAVGIGDGWLRLMTFELGGATPSIKVRTYSTHYKKHSTEAPSYAQWYKAKEKPQLSDDEFLRQDEFRIELSDFRARFGQPAAVTAR
jgi:hypothetical protein